MKTLYFDCFAGAAGDMILGALIDAGVPFDEVQRALGSLAVDGVSVSADRVLKAGVSSLKFRVHEHAAAVPTPASAKATADTPDAREATTHRHYHLKHIYAAIDRAALGAAAKTRATKMFQRLAEAEAAVHHSTMEKVHLHEVGAIDSIIDIVGTAFAMDYLDAAHVVVSPVNVGGGMANTAHGVFPVPAPATVRLLGPLPIYSSGIQLEMLTPTGALILSEYATGFGPMPPMRVARVGYGAGDRDLAETPNVVRVFVGEAAGTAPATQVSVLECEIDDMNPQIFGTVMDRLYAAGALEVFYQPVQMKKNRPGTLMTVVSAPDQRDTLAALMFRETTTIGIRYQEVARLCLDRELVSVPTAFGMVRFKVARKDGVVLNAQPEFDDLARAAAEHGVPIKMVQAAAQKAWLDSD